MCSLQPPVLKWDQCIWVVVTHLWGINWKGQNVGCMWLLFNEVEQVENGCDLSQIIAFEVYIIEIMSSARALHTGNRSCVQRWENYIPLLDKLTCCVVCFFVLECYQLTQKMIFGSKWSWSRSESRRSEPTELKTQVIDLIPTQHLI